MPDTLRAICADRARRRLVPGVVAAFAAWSFAVGSAGCSSDFLMLEVDASLLTADAVLRITSLEVTITHDGGEPTRSYGIDGELNDGVTDIAVRLGDATGAATFEVAALDVAGSQVAFGSSSGNLDADTTVRVILMADALPDGGTDALVPDGGTDTGTADAGDAAADAATCTPGEMSCVGSDLYDCVGGTLVMSAACPAGCVSSPAPHCGEVVPSNGLDPTWLTEATDPFDGVADTESSYTFNADDGEILAGATTLRPAGPGVINGIGFHVVVQGMSDPDIGVWTFTSFELPGGETADIVGTNAAGIMATTTIVVDGTLDAGARPGAMLGRNFDAGPGGFSGGMDNLDVGNGNGSGGGPGFGTWGIDGPVTADDQGGGGGGHGGAGGAGGDAPSSPSPAPGGVSYGTPELAPLIGGSGGGGGGGPSPPLSLGGGGGGAVQLVAGTSITVDGVVTAPGGFGGAGIEQDSGGGAGSGGALLLEAPLVVIGGTLAANGGGGGSGSLQGIGAPDGMDGERGRPDDTPAPGGLSIGAESADGGAGGAGTTCDGLDGLPEINAGGGGGGCGRVRINTLAGNAMVTGIVSPATATNLFTQGVLATQ